MRRIMEGTSAVLLQSSLDEKRWADSMECYCYLWNIQDLLSDGVEYHLISAKDLSRLHQFGSKVLPGKFLGYALHVGRIWKRDILVADIEDLEEMDASEIHAEKLNAEKVLTPMNGGKFIFTIADGTVKAFGGEQRLRTSTLTRERPQPGEEQEILGG